MLYAKGPQSSTRGAMILQAYLHPDAAAATAASNAQGTFTVSELSNGCNVRLNQVKSSRSALD